MSANLWSDSTASMQIRADGTYLAGKAGTAELTSNVTGLDSLTENQTVHMGASLRGADSGSCQPYVEYADTAGNKNWVGFPMWTPNAEWQRFEATCVVPSRMTITALGFNNGGTTGAIEIANPTFSYGTSGPILASDSHTPYATQDHVRSEYAAKATTLGGYGITDAYTQAQTDAAIASAIAAAKASEAAGGVPSTPTWDASAGCYDNASVRAWLSTVRDGREYGVRIPLTASTTLTKLGANAGMAVPTLSVGSVAGIDPYRGVGPFVYEEANGYVEPDGTPHVTAIRGGEAFSRTDADVFVLAPVLYVKYVTNADTMEIWVSDTWHPGYELQPHATLPDGTARPYMLYAKYPLGYVESGGSGAGHAASRSGLQPWTSSATNASGAASTAVSHDGLISIMATATTGYSGRSVADDWYLKVMFWLKYATKNSQAYFPQCSDYDLSYTVTVAESNASRVIISKENAANLVVGSSVHVGTDLNAHQAHRIKSIGTYDSKNSAVYLDGATVSPTTGTEVFPEPWFSGCCDAVEGDGVLGSGDKYPCVLQGIEFGHGMTEIVGDVIVSSDGGTGWHPYVCHDSMKEARSVTSDYVRCAKTLHSDSTDGWHYALAPDATDEGLIFGSTSGGGTRTGLCDGSYTNNKSDAGTREWQALGSLVNVSVDGLCCVLANGDLGKPWWLIGSRLSATGRSRG